MKNSIISLALMITCCAAQAGTVFFEMDNQSYHLNDTLSIDLIGRDFEKPLAGFGLNLSFDDSVLELKSVKVDPNVWEFVQSEGERMAGKIESIGGASFQGVGDVIKFATLEFIAAGPGISDLLLSNADDRNFAWSDIQGSAVTPVFSSAQVQVVPIPAAIWLMLSALVSMVTVGRSKPTAL